jgi:hypothetical protein
MIGPGSLSFRPIADGIAVCVGGRTKPIVVVVADQMHPDMFRVRHPNGGLSEMVNLARAKDAALTLAAAILNRNHPRISPAEAPPIAPGESSATPGRAA